tara:strand:- start:186851 stop:187411 length:561 start_codon:yes stop_codon:yes gene_type:complete
MFINSRFDLRYILVVILFAISCSPLDQEEIGSENQQSYPDQEAWDTVLYLSKEGRQEATIRTGHRLFFLESNMTVMDDGVQVTFFDKNGQSVSTLESNHGTINGLTNDLKVWGNVLVRSKDGKSLETDSLKWFSARNLIQTDATVYLTDGGDRIRGEGFEADPTIRNWSIQRQIRGEIRPNELPER